MTFRVKFQNRNFKIVISTVGDDSAGRPVVLAAAAAAAL
jgi:hypothetical protein